MKKMRWNDWNKTDIAVSFGRQTAYFTAEEIIAEQDRILAMPYTDIEHIVFFSDRPCKDRNEALKRTAIFSLGVIKKAQDGSALTRIAPFSKSKFNFNYLANGLSWSCMVFVLDSEPQNESGYVKSYYIDGNTMTVVNFDYYHHK